MKKTTVLCVLDGWGKSSKSEYSAIDKANTPNMDKFLNQYPNCKLQASGAFVGLPDGQMGNSEVGHMSIGAGRVVMQDLPKINKHVLENTLQDNRIIQQIGVELEENGGALHIVGLLSEGGVHSHQSHISEIARIFSDNDIPVYIHAILDGRDVSQKSAKEYLAKFYEEIKGYENIFIATIGGRYYGMDRDKRWDRIQKHYEAITKSGTFKVIKNEMEYIDECYKEGITDEFIPPVVLKGYDGVEDGDAMIFANFRADRMRQITKACFHPAFTEFKRHRELKGIFPAMMTEYSKEHCEYMNILFPKENIQNSLGEVISKAGLTQIRMSETEKYPHVTFFFSGGREEVFKGEDRIMVPSPKVATYDLQPEMSAYELEKKLINVIEEGKHDFVLVNFANPDMVGHTGVMSAAIKACETVDEILGRVVKKIEEKNGNIFITADHGNVEIMCDEKTGQPHTAHTTNPVPFVAIGEDCKNLKLKDGTLCNIASTVCSVMGLQGDFEESSLI